MLGHVVQHDLMPMHPQQHGLVHILVFITVQQAASARGGLAPALQDTKWVYCWYNS